MQTGEFAPRFPVAMLSPGVLTLDGIEEALHRANITPSPMDGGASLGKNPLCLDALDRSASAANHVKLTRPACLEDLTERHHNAGIANHRPLAGPDESDLSCPR